MSNHAGGHMLAALLFELKQIGLLEVATTEQRTRLAKVLWRIRWSYDCNWGEILDTEMALLLNVCIECGTTEAALDNQAVCPSCLAKT